VRCSLLLLIGLSFSLGSARAAHAQAHGQCGLSKPWVALSSRTPEAFAAALLSELRAGLSPSNIEVCDAASSDVPEPLAQVAIQIVLAARYRLEVTDSVTRKRVSRELDLSQLPADGRALALAVAAEELLRATWAELALRGAHSAQTAPPPEVQAVVQADAQPRPARRFKALGARLAFEHYLGGQTHYGADLFAAVPIGPVAALLLGVGARRALTVQAPHGSIGATGYAAELGLSLTFVQRTSLSVAVFASGRALSLEFQPEGEPGVAARPQRGVAFISRVGLALAFGRPGVLRSYSTLGGGLPLRAYSAADSGITVSGVSELELFGTTGLALELP
jgi:hypothetical protein